ncbi:hypothetical protein KC722_02085 [Candidatus Kaiserbacteria bacterium]|nr:hypothetical protein [Candidatus Kaiserbacteria bacterium]
MRSFFHAIIASLLATASALAATPTVSTNDGQMTRVVFTNHTPVNWTEVRLRPEVAADDLWQGVDFNGTEVRYNDTLSLDFPETPCRYVVEVSGHLDGEWLSGKYLIDVCTDPNPDLR